MVVLAILTHGALWFNSLSPMTMFAPRDSKTVKMDPYRFKLELAKISKFCTNPMI